MSADPDDPDFSTPAEPLPLVGTPLGSSEPLFEAYSRHYEALRKWVRRKASAEAAEQILSQVLDKLLERRPGTVTKMKAYLYKTAKHLRANYYRDQQLHRNKLRIFLAPEIEEDAPSVESVLLREQHRQLLKKTIAALPPRQRLATHLDVYEELSVPEITARFAQLGVQVSERTVSRYIVQGYAVCESALRASEEPKKEWQE